MEISSLLLSLSLTLSRKMTLENIDMSKQSGALPHGNFFSSALSLSLTLSRKMTLENIDMIFPYTRKSPPYVL